MKYFTQITTPFGDVHVNAFYHYENGYDCEIEEIIPVFDKDDDSEHRANILRYIIKEYGYCAEQIAMKIL